ncbi:MAG: hypothetical protein K2G51_00165, partial [Lachnospiraceae bacterium]|nr:hypothetical protein [Lachnospiraceae bacterium]
LLPTGNNSNSYTAKKTQKKTESTDTQGTAQTGENHTYETFSDEYRRSLEKELEEFLSSVAGVGEVKVLIYMKNSQEYIVEKDIPVSNSVNGENSELRKDESTVYTVNENGNEVPFIAQTKRPTIDGVIISAEGASNETVKLQIVRLVMALYGVEANKIEVCSYSTQ